MGFMKHYYYFCRNCGGDTATYDLIGSCPYCNAHKPVFNLVEEVDGSLSENPQLTEKIEMLRRRWTGEHPHQALGMPMPQHRSLFGRRRSPRR